MSRQVFHQDSYQKEIQTFVDTVDLINGSTALVLEDNIFHPLGGGQPNDLGEVIIRGMSFQVKNLVKKKGQIFVVLNSEISSSEELWGEEVKCVLDWERRYKIMRYHTGGHIMMSSARQTVSGYEPKGMEIQDNLSYGKIKFSSDEAITEQQASQIVSIAQGAINSDLEVDVKNYSNLEAAQVENKTGFRVDSDINLKGKVRVIVINGFDANPCGGTHVKSLNEIGHIKIQSTSYDSNTGEASVHFVVL